MSSNHNYFSQRTGANPNINGLPLEDIVELFYRVFIEVKREGYFDEALGFYCMDEGDIAGNIKDVELEMLVTIRKKNLWPIEKNYERYSEDDLFDVIEFLFQHVSKPIDGTMHSWNGCGMHWETFNQLEGRLYYRKKINQILTNYEKKFELSEIGEILQKADDGFEQIFEADLPSRDKNINSRVSAAVLKYRKYGSTVDDRRHAVRDLADVLEYLRPKVASILTKQDEKDLFNLANNFGVRHHNDKQKNNYDAALWLSWMFYYYLATIHVLLRKLQQQGRLG